MFKKTTIYLLLLLFLLESCADQFDSVKRGLTGAKKKSTDEFLVQKKDPLILPPDFENLPTPGEAQAVKEKVSSFEKSLTSLSSTEEIVSTSTSAASTEKSILKKIQSK